MDGPGHTPSPRPPALSRGWLAALAALALLLGLAAGLWLRPGALDLPGPPDPNVIRGPFSIGGDFELTDHTGGRTRLADLRGHAVLLFFGYTHCPDICPTALADMRLVVGRLAERSDRVRVVFVSVDPERDTPEALRAYVTHFDPRFLGLTGTAAEIDAVTRRYGAVYEIGPRDARGDYPVGHSAFTYLVGADGTLVAMFPYGTAWSVIADEVERQLASS